MYSLKIITTETKKCTVFQILPEIQTYQLIMKSQRAKKVVSGLVGFAIGLVFFFLNFPNGQVWGNSNHRRIVINPANQKGFWG